MYSLDVLKSQVIKKKRKNDRSMTQGYGKVKIVMSWLCFKGHHEFKYKNDDSYIKYLLNKTMDNK